MRRSTTVAVLAVVPFLAGCGGASSGGPPTTTARPDVAPTAAGPAPRPEDDPCTGGTRRQREAKNQGGCVIDIADRVVGRDTTLRLGGMSVRVRGVQVVDRIPVGGVERRPRIRGLFLVVRMFIANRRRTPVTLKRSAAGFAENAGQSEAEVWTTSGPGGALGPARSELRFRPGAAGNVVAVFLTDRESQVLYPRHMRFVVSIPDPPGTPARGGGRHPGITSRTGVIRMVP